MARPAAPRFVASLALAALGTAIAAPRSDLLMPVFDTPPWAYYDSTCAPQGIAVDVVRAIVDGAGLTLALRPEDAVRVPGQALGANAPVAEPVVLLSAHPARAGMLAFPQPVFEIELALLPGVDAGLHAPEDAAHRRIGYDVDERRVLDAINALQATPVPMRDYPRLVTALRDHQIDAIAGVREGLVYGFRAGGGARGAMPALIPLSRQPVYLHVEDRLPATLRDRLGASLRDFLGSRRYASLRERQLGLAAAGRITPRADCGMRD